MNVEQSHCAECGGVLPGQVSADRPHEPLCLCGQARSAARTDLGLAGTTATGRTEGAEAGVAPGERQDARPGDSAKVGEARSAACVRYEGEFELAWLSDGERVMSAGDGTGAAIIVSPDGTERRVNIGDEIDLGKGATGAKPADGAPCSNRDLGPSVSTDAPSAASNARVRPPG